MCHANTNQKKAGAAILISDRANFTARKLSEAEGHHIMIRGQLPKMM